MCETKFDIIEQNEAGIVAICDQCEHLHLEIGTFTSVVSRESFEDICRFFIERKSNIGYLLVKTPSGKRVLVPVANNTFLTLTEDEFFQVSELFEFARHMLKTKELLELI